MFSLKKIKSIKRFSLHIITIIFILILWFIWSKLSSIGEHQGYKPIQPIAFSHKVHAGDNEIECIYCHFSAAKGPTAGIPPLNVCMNCHKFIYESEIDTTGAIKKLHKAIHFDYFEQSYGEKLFPISWIKIHDLPDLVNFNHFQHYVIANLECEECHGEVEEMDILEQTESLTMQWCIDCHKTTRADTLKNNYYKVSIERLKERYKGKIITIEHLGGLDCGKCHY